MLIIEGARYDTRYELGYELVCIGRNGLLAWTRMCKHIDLYYACNPQARQHGLS